MENTSIIQHVGLQSDISFEGSFSESLLSAIASVQNLTITDAEENYRMEAYQPWFRETLVKTFYAVGVYLVVIFGGKRLMKTREKFELTNLLILWNFGLALFSLFGALRVIPELLHVLFNRNEGFYQSVCMTGYFENRVLGYWNMLFVLSKLVELGDTVFIVLRKQPLILLHWYHHITVLVFTWYTAADCSAPSRWYSSLNFLIHFFMYSYYGLRALKVKIPKPIALAITSMQLVQMVVGVVVITAALIYKRSGYLCEISDNNISAGLAIYISYWLLFARFFYKAYLRGSKKGGPVHRDKKTD